MRLSGDSAPSSGKRRLSHVQLLWDTVDDIRHAAPRPRSPDTEVPGARHLRHPDTAHTLKELCECCGLFGHDLVVREELAVSYTHALVEPHRSVRRSLVRRCRHRRQDRHEACQDDLRVARLSAHQGGRGSAAGRKPIRPMLTRYAPGVRLRTTKEPSSFVTRTVGGADKQNDGLRDRCAG